MNLVVDYIYAPFYGKKITLLLTQGNKPFIMGHVLKINDFTSFWHWILFVKKCVHYLTVSAC